VSFPYANASSVDGQIIRGGVCIPWDTVVVHCIPSSKQTKKSSKKRRKRKEQGVQCYSYPTRLITGGYSVSLFYFRAMLPMRKIKAEIKKDSQKKKK
jgi:hypothetical protein